MRMSLVIVVDGSEVIGLFGERCVSELELISEANGFGAGVSGEERFGGESAKDGFDDGDERVRGGLPMWGAR